MAPKTRSATAPAREVAEAKEAAAIIEMLQGYMSDETSYPRTKKRRVTREMRVRARIVRTEASRQAVLQTNELLESILSCLSPKALFAYQRVSKQWHAVIAKSPRLQKKMYLRIDKIPKQHWEVTKHFGSNGRLVRRVDFAPDHPSLKTSLAPTILSPHLVCLHQGLDSDLRTSGRTEMIALPPLQGLALGSYSTLLDTYICNPPCYKITWYLSFAFVPAIPSYSHLDVRPIAFRTDKALKLGETLAKALAVRTEMTLVADRPGNATSKRFSNVTTNDILTELQDEHQCTAIVCVGDPEKDYKGPLMILNSVFVSTQEQWRSVNAAYAELTQRMVV